MDLGTFGSMVSTLGFPIASFVACFFGLKYVYDCARVDVQDAHKQVNEMVTRFSELSESINHNTEALRNQTVLLTKLFDKEGDV